MITLEQRQRQIEEHHGGDGEKAAQRTLDNFARHHNEVFWTFWQQAVLQRLPASPKRLLDLGCGTAQFLQAISQQLPHVKLTGIECAPYMLAKQVSLPTDSTLLVDDLNAPERECIEPSSQHIIMANMLLHELEQPISALLACHHWLADDGLLVVIDMVRQPLASYLPHALRDTAVAALSDTERAFHFRQFQEHNRYTADDLAWLLTECGFEICHRDAIRSGRAARFVVRKAPH